MKCSSYSFEGRKSTRKFSSGNTNEGVAFEQLDAIEASFADASNDMGLVVAEERVPDFALA